ncbi:2844_t:CDS:2 [Funneliformis mosseae]|uniref:2844_t:CDS:1 n=1 Tax=Funneliformis mosseae TaxID=27381 RepID=A0A9N9A311_FUNMO|nr:2844_t:CDS:2 [Funneliformis mosseae]
MENDQDSVNGTVEIGIGLRCSQIAISKDQMPKELVKHFKNPLSGK